MVPTAFFAPFSAVPPVLSAVSLASYSNYLYKFAVKYLLINNLAEKSPQINSKIEPNSLFWNILRISPYSSKIWKEKPRPLSLTR